MTRTKTSAARRDDRNHSRTRHRPGRLARPGFLIQNPTIAANGRSISRSPQEPFYLGGNRVELEQIDISRRNPDWSTWLPRTNPRAGRLQPLRFVFVECWAAAGVGDRNNEMFEIALGCPDTGVRMRLMRRVRVVPGVVTEIAIRWATVTAQWTARGSAPSMPGQSWSWTPS